jgi:chromate transporter
MKENKLLEVAKVFFKLGTISFGGPAAHVAMMEDELVVKRKWVDRQHFLDLMGATNLIPGPNSTELTMHLGYERGGIPGLFLAGISFIFPAVSITLIFAFLYVKYGQLPEVAPFIYGIKPAVLAIIAGAIFKLGQKALKNWQLGVLGAAVVAASLWGVNEILALLGAGVLGACFFYFRDKFKEDKLNFLPLILLQVPKLSIATWKIFFTFLKVGAVLYGSGYVLFAYLDAELVTNGFLSRAELMDAIAVGQFTPGPVLSTATFIGYQLGGFGGALAATVGIFLPSFLFVWLLNPLVSKMRASKFLSHFLDCVNIAAVAVMIAVLFVMTMESLVDWKTIAIALLGFIYTFTYKKSNSLYTVLGGALLGYVLSYL